MLQGILVKKVLDLVMKHLMKNFALDKFDKIVDYVEKPNDLDKQIDALHKKIDKYGKYIEDLEKNVAEVKKVSHTPIDGLTDRLKHLEKKARF